MGSCGNMGERSARSICIRMGLRWWWSCLLGKKISASITRWCGRWLEGYVIEAKGLVLQILWCKAWWNVWEVWFLEWFLCGRFAASLILQKLQRYFLVVRARHGANTQS